jgi:methylmalonyl-CoA mutase N-terminal domain/subunit
MGGMVEAIERGFPQREIQNAAYAAQLAVDRKEAIVVGVNQFTLPEPPPEGLLRVNDALEAEQVARTQAFRASRDTGAAMGALDALQEAAAGTENVMPRILAAVEAKATLGEIADRLRGVFGEYRERVVV